MDLDLDLDLDLDVYNRAKGFVFDERACGACRKGKSEAGRRPVVVVVVVSSR